MLIKMIDDDNEDPGPMPTLEGCVLADLNARHEAQQQVLAESRAVSKQKDDALEAQMLRMARAVEERRKARDKEDADSDENRLGGDCLIGDQIIKENK